MAADDIDHVFSFRPGYEETWLRERKVDTKLRFEPYMYVLAYVFFHGNARRMPGKEKGG